MVEIQYNGVTLANLKADQSAILECTNQKMLGPVIVAVSALPYYDGSVNISGGVELISFTINGTAYQAEDGMNWFEWCESEYNTGGVRVSPYNRFVYVDSNTFITNNGTAVFGDAPIIANAKYGVV